MKNLKTTCMNSCYRNSKATVFFIGILFISFIAKATVTDTVIVTPPANLAACMTDTFTVQVHLNGTDSMKLSIRDSVDFNTGSFPNSCDSSSSVHISSLHFISATPALGLTFTYDATTKCWVTPAFLYNGPVTIKYAVWIDCGLLSVSSGSSSTVDLLQIFTDLKNNYAFYFSSSGNDTLQTLNIKKPSFSDITRLNFQASYHTTDTILYFYKNTGNTDANVLFSFNPDAPGNCGIDSLLTVQYKVGDTTNVKSISFANTLIPGHEYAVLVPKDSCIMIRKRTFITGCLNSCNSEQAIFQWRCNYADSLSAFTLCESCHKYDVHDYFLSDSLKPSLVIKKILPVGNGTNDTSDVSFYDHSCSGDSIKWEYHIVNNGKQVLPYTYLEMYDNFDHYGYGYLTLIDSTSIHISTNGCANCSYTDSMSIMPLASCSSVITKPLRKLRIYIYNLAKNDSVTLRFSTYKCCEENNATLMNVPKFFNRWQINLSGKNACNQNVPVTVPANTFSGTTSGSISSYWYNSGANLNLDLDFMTTLADLNIPPDTSWGDTSMVLQVDIKKIVGGTYDYQLLGCNTFGGCNQFRGYIRATVHCDTGLVVFAPLDSVRITRMGTNLHWQPDYFYKDIPNGVCRDGSYYFYFNLDSLTSDSLLNNSRFEFYLQACCTAPPQSAYDISFHLLENASGSCNALTFPSGNSLPPTCTGSCCFLPLSHIGKLCADHCPGCLSVGMQSDAYKMFRTSMGFNDVNNNMQADTPVTAINPTYISNYGSMMKIQAANHGDLVEDRLTAHLQEGDQSSGGYTLPMLNDSGVVLNVMQLFRTITPLDSTTDFGLIPYYFKLYIDTPDVSAPSINCIDCSDFSQAIAGYRTQSIIQADTLDSLGYYLTTNYPEFRYLYTFDARNDSNLFHNIVYSDSLFPFKRFHENQRYRLKVKYGVKKFFFPPSDVSQSIDEQRKETNIFNYMFLTGRPHGIDSIRFDNVEISEMPNDVSGLPNPLTQAFGDDHAFICAPKLGKFYFYCDEALSYGDYTHETGNRCHRYMHASAITRTGGNVPSTEKYPYEFRLPSFTPYKWRFYVPSGYSADTLGEFRSGSPVGSFSVPYTFQVPNPVSNYITIYADSLPQPSCYATGMSYTGNNRYKADQLSWQDIKINLHALSCNTDSIFASHDTDIVTWFRDNRRNCTGTFTPFSDTMFTRTIKGDDTLRTPQPSLSINFTPSIIPAQTHHVCWAFNLFVYDDDAYNVFLVPPVSGYFSNWTASVNNGTPVATNGNGVIPLSTLLPQNPNPYLCQLCADYTSCDTMEVPLPLFYGWNCDGFPSGPFPDTTVCFLQTDTISYSNGSVIASVDTLIVPDTFKICEPLHIGACFSSTGTGAIYPYQFVMDSTSLPSTLLPQFAYIYPCNNPSDTAMLSSTSTYTWNITSAVLDSIGQQDTSLSNSDCLCMIVQLQPGCSFDTSNIPAPSVTLNYFNYCNDTSSIFASKTGHVIKYGGSVCTDCFSLSKTVSTDTASVGDTVTFTISVCGNNGSPQLALLNDLLPDTSQFTVTANTLTSPYITVPADSCISFTISGYFHNSGLCNDPGHINTAELVTGSLDTLYADTCVTILEPCYYQSNIQILDSTYSSSLFYSTYSGDSIFIFNRFYVDNYFTLNQCKVYVGSGGQIIVTNTGVLNLDSTTVMGCEDMWQGILAQDQSAVYIREFSSVYDAYRAVDVYNVSTVEVSNSYLTDNVTGIYVQPGGIIGSLFSSSIIVYGSAIGMQAASFKPYYSGQPLHGSKPETGIEANDIVINIGDDYLNQNQFYNMNMGIIGKNSYVSVYNAAFSGIRDDSFYGNPYDGTAMVSVGRDYASMLTAISGSLTASSSLITVRNSNRGIYTSYSGLYASKLKINLTGIGVYSEYCTDGLTSEVYESIISVKSNGIRWRTNTGTGGMLAWYNTITVNHGNSGIYLSEGSSSDPVGYNCYNNAIYVDSSSNGINALNINSPYITFNRVYISGVPDTFNTRGIRLYGCDYAYLSCNGVKGKYPTDSYHNRGILSSISTNSTITCNSVDSTYLGVFFGGICTGTQFKGNDFHIHYTGLYLNNFGVIDTQTHAGNRWLDSCYSGYGAVNLDTPFTNVAKSIFIVNPSYSYLAPSVPLSSGAGPYYVDNNGWFDVASGSTFDCFASNSCNTFGEGGGGGSLGLMMMIAEDSALTSNFIPESKMIAKQYLYDKLQTDNVLLQSQTVFQDFVSDNESSSIGYLYDTKTSLKEANQMDSVLQDTLKLKYELMRSFTDTVHLIDSLTIINPNINYSQNRQAIINRMSLVRQEIDNLITDQKYISISKVSEATINNSLVNPTEIPDANEKFINDIEIKFHQGGKDSLFTYYNDIFSIASECPFQGGKSVYRARHFVSLFNDTTDFDDDDICAQNGIYRKTYSKLDSENLIVKIIPNPADQTANVILQNNPSGICEIKITDVTNRLVFKKQFDCNEGKYVLNTKLYQPGVYMVHILFNGKYQESLKLIIAR